MASNQVAVAASAQLSREMSTFSAPNFKAEEYAHSFFVNYDVNQAATKVESLQEKHNKITQSLKQNLNEHYEDIISVSKSIVGIESDIVSIRGVIEEMGRNIKGLQSMSIFDNEEEEQESKPRYKYSFSQHNSEEEKQLQRAQVTLVDDLGMAIAERNYARAVDLIEQADSIRDPMVNNTVNEHIQILSEVLCFDLQYSCMRKGDSRRVIDFLVRLGQSEKAMSIFLQGRSDEVRLKVRKLQFEGDTVRYISDLSQTVFSIIMSTCSDFRTIFQNKAMMSGFVVWATKEIEYFSEIFRRQVYSSDEFATVAECTRIAFMHCRLLERAGLAMTFHLTRTFHENIVTAIDRYFKRMSEDIEKYVEADRWTGKKHVVHSIISEEVGSPSRARSRTRGDNRTVKLTDSGRKVYAMMDAFVADISVVLNLKLFSQIVSGIDVLFESYVKLLKEHVNKEGYSDKQYLAIMANIYYVAGDLVPEILQELTRRFKRPVLEIEGLQGKLQRQYIQARDSFCVKMTNLMVNKQLWWCKQDYSLRSVDPSEVIAPSASFGDAFITLDKLASHVSLYLNSEAVPIVIQRIIDDMASKMNHDAKFWDPVAGAVSKVARGGLQQLVLDMDFFVKASGKFASDTVMENTDEIKKKIVALYSKQVGVDEGTLLMSKEWFEKCLDDWMRKFRQTCSGDGLDTYK